MNTLLFKELKLATPAITYWFLAFTLMTFIPNYPLLVGSFFVCLGIFYGYQFGREDNDILYSVLLPVRKGDIVSAKFHAACLIEGIAIVMIALFSAIRIVFLSSLGPYAAGSLMNSNLYCLGCVFLVFTLFNTVFIGSFFKTAYKVGSPFLRYCIFTLLFVTAAEVLIHIPGFSILTQTTPAALLVQGIFLLGAIGVYVSLTALTCHLAKSRFEKLDILMR